MFQLQYVENTRLENGFLLCCTALLNTRGTSEPQGQSAGFRTMNANVQSQLPGGKIVSPYASITASG
jgi:hypothetical protein